jgi:hypothetical protein
MSPVIDTKSRGIQATGQSSLETRSPPRLVGISYKDSVQTLVAAASASMTPSLIT